MDDIDNYMAIYKKQNEKQIYRLWECVICGERFSNAEYLETHLRSCHEDAFEPADRMKDIDKFRKLIYEGVNEVFNKAGKHQVPAYFNLLPPTQEEIERNREISRKLYAEYEERNRIFRLTHKYKDGLRMYCPRCAREFDVDDGTYQYYEDHVSECIKDCTGCDSFESEERCARCYTYSLWAERILDATR